MEPYRDVRSLLEQNAAIDEFQTLTHTLVRLVGRENLTLLAYRDYPYHFAALAPDSQSRVLQRLREYLAICDIVCGQGAFLRDDHRFLWAALSRMGLRPSSDLFARLRDNDLIEIISSDAIQLFRNLLYFTVSSYTLDDLLCRPWFELFRRDQSISDDLLEASDHIFRTNSRETHNFEVGVHTLDEVDSEQRLHCVVENRFAAPLLGRFGRVEALVIVSSAVSIEPGV